MESIPVLTGIQYIFTGKQNYNMESKLNFNGKDPTQKLKRKVYFMDI